MFYLPLSPDEILAVHVSCFYEKMFFYVNADQLQLNENIP